jgi:hypothetical protein
VQYYRPHEETISRESFNAIIDKKHSTPMLAQSYITEDKAHKSGGISFAQNKLDNRSSMSPSSQPNYWPRLNEMTNPGAVRIAKPAYCRLGSTQFDYYIRFLPFGLLYIGDTSQLVVCKFPNDSRTAAIDRDWRKVFDRNLVNARLDFNSNSQMFEMTIVSDRHRIVVDGCPRFQNDRVSMFHM